MVWIYGTLVRDTERGPFSACFCVCFVYPLLFFLLRLVVGLSGVCLVCLSGVCLFGVCLLVLCLYGFCLLVPGSSRCVRRASRIDAWVTAIP